MIPAVRRYYGQHPLAFDITLLVIVTTAAALLRLVLLGRIPYGVHPDEAQLGTDARKILDGNLWTVYTTAVLGQPSGHAYLTLPSFLLLGWTPLAMRLPLALVGTAAIPLLYLFVRQGYGRAEAFFASAMLAVSYWHLFYSRVAHWSISYGTITLTVLLCLLLGMNTRVRWWFGAAGLFLGLGFYTYNIYPIAVIAIFAFLAITTLMRYRRGEGWRWWRGSMLTFVGVSVVVALPMIIYVSDPDSFFWFHVRNYSEVGVWRTPAYKDEDALGKLDLIARQLETFFGAFAWDGALDDIDGSGIRPMFDPAVSALLLVGLTFAWRERRNPVTIAALCCLFIIPLPAMLQQGSITRQPLAAAPFVCFIAAFPLAALWRAAVNLWLDRQRVSSVAVAAVACTILAVITATTVHDYFWTWRKDDWPRLIYHAEITTAADYVDSLPEGTFVLFYSSRAPLNLEVFQFLAPDVEGANRSFEYSNLGRSIELHDPTRPTAFVLLDDYVDLLPEIEAQYPGGVERIFRHDGKFDMAAYEIPAQE